MNKKRLIIYGSFLLITIVYLVVYIDYNKYNNITKFFYSHYPKHDLSDFDNVYKSIEGDNMLGGQFIVKNDKPYLAVDNFDDILLDSSNKIILEANQLHPTQRLALFSMGYLLDYFTERINENEINEAVIEQIGDCYLFIYQEIANPFSKNYFTINDHAISERVQFLAVFSSYVKKYYPEKENLLNALQRDYNLCVNLLMDTNFFTWQTNHGIMQLRSLGQLLAITSDPLAKKKIIQAFDKRLKDITPYFIGEDGAIYESATEYWHYIYSQFLKISKISEVQDLKSIQTLASKLNDTQFFLNYVASNDGYMEGIGDSYSYYLSPKDTLEIDNNRFFDFSNNLAGANWTFDDNNINILFTSLYTPPNVHKQPDDLMVSLYINHPFFSNTGTYSYDYSKERIFFRNAEDAHSTVSFDIANFTKSDSSCVQLKTIDLINSKAIMMGKKFYKNGDIITREVNLNPNKGELVIQDESNNDRILKSSFNLNPNTRIFKISNNKFTLLNSDSIAVVISSNHIINLVESIISTEKEKIDTVQRLEVKGKNNVISIHFNAPTEILSKFSVHDSDFTSRMRKENSLFLKEKYYEKSKVGLRTKLVYQFGFIIIAFIFLSFFFEIKHKPKNT
ncbi:heparinase II/III family protein [uncultured Maribacter sp.]|uniref:heparinase II/III domain-containing protein n=1 Tax=uncultured Maribacter sp. TaxID=431308 RepID=UPI0030ED8456|tara:strand:+ start:52390 stop:54252 length:1863 start_codon:yes stop_codon:yes gene_type:complete